LTTAPQTGSLVMTALDWENELQADSKSGTKARTDKKERFIIPSVSSFGPPFKRASLIQQVLVAPAPTSFIPEAGG
jgi:hypothetical protein